MEKPRFEFKRSELSGDPEPFYRGGGTGFRDDIKLELYCKPSDERIRDIARLYIADPNVQIVIGVSCGADYKFGAGYEFDARVSSLTSGVVLRVEDIRGGHYEYFKSAESAIQQP